MPIPQKLTKTEFAALPDATREFYQTNNIYVADGEDWKLDAAGVEDVTGLKSALKKEREAAAEAKRLLAAEQEKIKGVDVEEYNRLKLEAESKETDTLKKENKIEEILEKSNAKHQQVVQDIKKGYEEQITTLRGDLDRVVIDNGLRSVLIEAGVMPDRLDDAVTLTKVFAKRNEKGQLVLLDKDSEVEISPDVYAREVLKEEKPWLYAASGAGGSGASNGTNGSSLKGVDLSTLSATERLKAANRAEASK